MPALGAHLASYKATRASLTAPAVRRFYDGVSLWHSVTFFFF
jgi:hypothetical protein